MRIKRHYRGSDVRIRAAARWRQDKVRAGESGYEVDGSGRPAYTVVGTERRALNDRAILTVERQVSVRLRRLNGRAVHIRAKGPARTRTGGFVGVIRNVGGHEATARWKQVKGPRVRFKKPRVVHSAASSVGQHFVIPKRTRTGTRLRFKLAVKANGQKTVARRSLTVYRHREGRFAARERLLKKLAKRTRQEARKVRHGLPVDPSRYRAHIGGRHVPRVQPGQRMELQFHAPDRVLGASWNWLDGTPLPNSTLPTPSSVSFTAPQRLGIHMLRGVARLADGSRISRTAFIVVVPPTPVLSQPGSNPRTRGPAADQAAAFPCNLPTNPTITLADGSSLTIPKLVIPADCTSASTLSFQNASLKYDKTTLGSVTGVIDAGGMSLTRLVLSVPASLRPYLPGSVTDATLTATAPANSALTVPWVHGRWGSLQGQLDLSAAMQFLPLPAQWQEAASLTFTDVNNDPDLILSVSGTAPAGQDSGGRALVQVDLGGPASQITVTASNLAVVQTTMGDQLDFSVANATIALNGSGTAVTVAMSCPTPVDGTCALAEDLSLSNDTELTWSRGSGLTLPDVALTFGPQQGGFAITASGSYNGIGDWSLAVAPAGNSWPIGTSGISIQNVEGTISEKPGAGTSTMAVDLGGSVSGLQIGSELDVTSLTASISNLCPANDPSCSPQQVNAAIVVDANADLFGDQVDFTVTGAVDLDTMSVDFDATETADVDFGPAALNITSATLTLTNEELVGSCVPEGDNANGGGSNQLSLGVAATGTAYGQPISFQGDVNSAGYCLWGSLGNLSQGVFSGTDVVLAYSSYQDGASIGLPSGGGTLTVPAGDIVLQGGIQVPAAVVQGLSLPPGQATFTGTADVDLAGFTASAAYTLDEPALIAGETSNVALALDDIQLQIGLSDGQNDAGPSATLSLVVNGSVIVSSDGTSCPVTGGSVPGCSTTPVGGSIGVTLNSGQFAVNLQFGVETGDGVPCPAAVPGDPDATCIDNAFGQEGLDLAQLAISASAGMPGGLTLAFNSAAFLPANWTSDIALVNDPAVVLSFDLSETTPCLQFAIGEENSGTTYLNVANAGVVTASYVDLVIAPQGCVVPVGGGGSETIAPGYAFVFDGQILGDSIQVSMDVSFQSSDGDPGMYINESLSLESFNLLGVMSVDNTAIQMIINQDDDDSSQDSFQMSFMGGFSVGDPSVAGGTVSVNGYLNSSGGGDFTMVLGGSGDLEFVDVFSAQISSTSNCPGWTQGLPTPVFNGQPQPYNSCLIAIQVQDNQLVYADVSADFSITVLGETASGQIDLIYQNDELQDLHAALGATLNFWVGSVGGTAYIDYCLGSLNTGNGATNSTSCSIGGQTAVFRVYFAGTISLGPCGDHWYDDLCWTDNFSDTLYPV